MKRKLLGDGERKPTSRNRGSSSRTVNSRPSKRFRKVVDDTSRLTTAEHLAEHAGSGFNYLSTRPDPLSQRGTNVPSLVSLALQAVARNFRELYLERDGTVKDEAIRNGTIERMRFLPSPVQTALQEGVLASLQNRGAGDAISPVAISKFFLHDETEAFSLTPSNGQEIAGSASRMPTLKIHKLLLDNLGSCRSLKRLNLSFQTDLKDGILAPVLAKLSNLEDLNLRGCTKAGDKSIVAISKAAESGGKGGASRLKVVNLNFTGVTKLGLKSLMVRCRDLEVLKLANVNGLDTRSVNELVDEATHSAVGWKHIPLSRLRSLKLRSTSLSDAALGRILGLCKGTLERLDISHTHVKSLDILRLALFPPTTPDANGGLQLPALPSSTSSSRGLEKLVISNLPIKESSLIDFFESLASRPENVRNHFKTLKMGSIFQSSPGSTTRLGGVTLSKILVYLERMGGLVHVSLFENDGLASKGFESPMGQFIARVGARCQSLDLTGIPLQTSNETSPLDGLYPGTGLVSSSASNLETLVLDGTGIGDSDADAIASCHQLKSLHLANTRITSEGLSVIMASCPRLQTLNLTGCRGVPVVWRRDFFRAWEQGEVQKALVDTL